MSDPSWKERMRQLDAHRDIHDSLDEEKRLLAETHEAAREIGREQRRQQRIAALAERIYVGMFATIKWVDEDDDSSEPDEDFANMAGYARRAARVFFEEGA